MPPSGVKESCMALTAPHDAAVVTAANNPESAMPKRASLPSMLPSEGSTPRCVSSGLPCCSKWMAAPASTTNSRVIAVSTAQPWRWSPTMRPKAKHSAAGIRKIDSISMKLDKGVGFSNGCAELALKNPPPLVPSILIASCEATGPMASVWVVGSCSVATSL